MGRDRRNHLESVWPQRGWRHDFVSCRYCCISNISIQIRSFEAHEECIPGVQRSNLEILIDEKKEFCRLFATAAQYFSQFMLFFMTGTEMNIVWVLSSERVWTILARVCCFILQMFGLNMVKSFLMGLAERIANQAFPEGSALFNATGNVFLTVGVEICNLYMDHLLLLPQTLAILCSSLCLLLICTLYAFLVLKVFWQYWHE